MGDPVLGLSANEPCWCRSGVRHEECHGNRNPPSNQGDPVPPDKGESTYISPTTLLDTDWLIKSFRGEPVYSPRSNPQQRPLKISDLVVEVVGQLERSTVGLDLLVNAHRKQPSLRDESIPRRVDSPAMATNKKRIPTTHCRELLGRGFVGVPIERCQILSHLVQ